MGEEREVQEGGVYIMCVYIYIYVYVLCIYIYVYVLCIYIYTYIYVLWEGYIYIMTDLHCFMAETNVTLCINYPPTKEKCVK